MAMGQSFISALHVTPEMQEIYTHWEAFKGHLTVIAFNTTNDAAHAPPTLDRLSWEAIVPVAARSIVPTQPNVPARFAITELRGIPKAGLDHFVLATASNGKRLYGAFVTNSLGEPRLQQLFEFTQAAINAGVFLPVPTVGRHFQGVCGLEYSCRRFSGSIADLPPLLRWPASPTSVCLPPVPWVHQAPVQGLLHPAAAINPAPPTDHEVHDFEDSIISPHPTQSPAETPKMNAECNRIAAPSHKDCLSSSFEDAAEQQLQGVPDSSAPSSTNEAVSPHITAADEHPQLRVLEGVEVAPSASGATVLAASAQRVPERCHPCSLCAACKEFWGIPCLSERQFVNPRKEGFRAPDGDVPVILCSEKTAARKRKWKQSRHGPKSKTSEYRGVNFYQRTWKWEAHIWHQSKQVYLGASFTKTHAAQVYDRAALFLFGPDAEINFKPESYQEEYEFMQRLSYTQMVIYLRRESLQNGAEAKYPGVSKEKAKEFKASYRPRKEKESHEHIGYFTTEPKAMRAVLEEAKRRGNYEMVEKIFDVHHLRTVKPATGKIKQRRPRIVAATKVGGSNSSNRCSNRGQRAAKPNSVIQTEGATNLPTQEVAIAPPKRKYVKKAAKSKQSAAAMDTATAPVTKKAPRGQETEAAATPKRKYIRKSTEAQDKNASKRSTQGPVPAREVIDPAPVVAAVEAPPSQNVRTTRKRKSTTKSNSSPAAKRSASASTPLTQLLHVMAPGCVAEEAPPAPPAPLRVYRPRRCCNRCKSIRVPGSTATPWQLLPNATPRPMTVAAAAAPTSPAQIPASSAHPFMATQPPLVTYDFISGSFKSGHKTGSDHSGNHTHSPFVEGEPSGYASGSCVFFGSAGPIPKRSEVSYQTPPQAVADQRIAREDEMRQFQQTCNVLAMQRRSLHSLNNLQLLASVSSKSPGIIRPVAKRMFTSAEWDWSAWNE